MRRGAIFTYANAGLGHLRVTDALFDGAPPEIEKAIIKPEDTLIEITHRLSSTCPILRKFSLWWQSGVQSEIFTKLYVKYLRLTSGKIRKLLISAINSFKIRPDEVLVICSHFSLAHKIAAVRKSVEKEMNLNLKLIVQVTDDSPQDIWYVEGADMIFVPSKITQTALNNYGKENNIPKVTISVNPYPLSRVLTSRLSPTEIAKRSEQLNPLTSDRINVSVPVSGAAVGTNFLKSVMIKLEMLSPKYIFYIVSKQANYTKDFLQFFYEDSRVSLATSPDEKTVVNNYEEIFAENIISIEITKPSEQAFKAILNKTDRGGVILLFTTPIGRQEYDNLDFLQRHDLIPDTIHQKQLWEGEITDISVNWRGLKLPNSIKSAAEFINMCLENKIFQRMSSEMPGIISKEDTDELGGEGVNMFWKKLLYTEE